MNKQTTKSLEDKDAEKNIYYSDNNIVILIVIFLLIGIASIFLINSIELKSMKQLSYKESGDINYKVFLKKNKYYEEKYLIKNQKYIADLIDKIDIDFNYNALFNEKIDYNTNYYIESLIKIIDNENDNKTIYEKTSKQKVKNIKKNNKQILNVDEDISIDYDEYRNLVNAIRKEYHLEAKGYLELRLYIDTNFTYNRFNKQQEEIGMLFIKIPLSTDIVDISTTKKNINEKQIVSEKNNTIISNKPIFIISIVIYIVVVIMMIKIGKKIIGSKYKKSEYEKKLQKILKEYDRVIVDAKKEYNLKDYHVIDVVSFEELLDVKENIDSPIIHITLEQNKNLFIIRDGEDIYRYLLEDIEIL